MISAVSLTGIGAVLTLVASTLAGIMIARNAGPEGYGVFAAANLIVFVGSVFCSFGLPLALAKQAATEEERHNYETMRRRQTTVLILLLAFTLCVSLAIAWNLPRLEQLLNVTFGHGFSLALPAMFLGAVISDYVQGLYTGLLRLRPVLVITLCGPVAVIAYGLLRREGVSLPIWGAVAALYCTSGTVAAYCLFRDRLLGKPCALADLKPLANDVLPAAAFIFFSAFSVSIDRWVVGLQLGAAAIGAYAAAVMVIQAALRIPKHIAYVMVPTTARVTMFGDRKWSSFNARALQLYGLFAALITVILMLAPTTITRILFGPGFIPAAPVLLLMAPTLIAAAVSIPITSILTGSAKSRFVIYLLGGTLVPRTILLWLCTRSWGLSGAAIATLVSEFLLAAMCIFVARKASISFRLADWYPPVVAAGIAYLVGYLGFVLTANEIVASALGFLIFCASSWKSVARLLAGNVTPEPRPADI